MPNSLAHFASLIGSLMRFWFKQYFVLSKLHYNLQTWPIIKWIGQQATEAYMYPLYDEVLLTETAIWPIFFSLNVITALKGTLFFHFYWNRV